GLPRKEARRSCALRNRIGRRYARPALEKIKSESIDRVSYPGGLEAVEDQPYRHRAFADGSRSALASPAADVSDGEDARPAGLQEQRRHAVLQLDRGKVGTGEQESVAVFGELAGQPSGSGFGADEDEQPADGQLR